jgi:urease accessory protein
MLPVSKLCALALLAALWAADPAAAHHPMGGAVPTSLWHGLLSGLGHPLFGVDHLAFLVGIGVLAGMNGLGAAVPLAFVGASLAGVLLAAGGTALAGAEALVAGSVAVVGLVMALAWSPARPVWLMFAVAAGIVHGLVFGETIIGAEATPVVAYLAGLAAVQGNIAAAAFQIGRSWHDNPFLRSRARGAGIVLLLLGASYAVIAYSGA